MKGNTEAAASALSSIRGQPSDSDYIKDELAEIVANHEYESTIIQQQTYLDSWTSCFKGSVSQASSNLRRTILGFCVQVRPSNLI